MTESLVKLRNRHFLLIDILAFLITPIIALLLRTDGISALFRYRESLILVITVFLLVKIAIFFICGLYRLYWRYASIDELAQITIAGFAAICTQSLLFFAVLRPASFVHPNFPRSLPLIDGLLTLLVAGGVRYSVRLVERLRQRNYDYGDAKHVLVVGAGQTGVAIVKEMQAKPQLGMHPVAFVDDNPEKYHRKIQGLRVSGNRHQIPQLVRETHAQLAVIAMPTAAGKVIRELVQICEAAGVQTKTIPGFSELLGGRVSVSQLRDVQIEDLLRRKPVRTDTSAVRELIRGKRILVTGGGGSIGSELCRQVLHCKPAELVVVGHGENSVFEIYNELLRQAATINLPLLPDGRSSDPMGNSSDSPEMACSLKAVIADIRFPKRIQDVFQQYQPEIVFHAAAHKHVPLMELNPVEAITNNVIGTRNLLDAAVRVGVEHFIMISTDKAVNPTSLMGASKRAAELLVHHTAVLSGKPYLAVRFGNVLGSRGSVVLTFKKQIAAGGPITVTDPEMSRFFMTIPEAVQLVLQAATLGKGGEVFTLDMGEPVKIVDLARDMISLSGLEEGRDIDIVFTGSRPGEKLFEELFVAGEDFRRTIHEKIFIAYNASGFVPLYLDESIHSLERAAQDNNPEAILQILQDLIPQLRRNQEHDKQYEQLSEKLQVKVLGSD
jgi:FlaA1/EpsC-like NDP-sugar epimerase